MTYGYLRVSTNTQDVEGQKIGITKKAEELLLTVDRWIEDDAISGTVSFEKRKLGKLMKILKKDDTIIASEMSRFARKLFLLFEFLSFVTKKEVQLWTVKDKYHLNGSIQSTILAFAFGMSAQIERDMISQRTIEGLQRRREEGIVLGRPMGSKSIICKSDKKRNEIEKYASKGISYSAIGKLVNLHRLTVKKLCDKYLITNGKDNTKVTKNIRERSEKIRIAKTIRLIDEKINEQVLIESFRENYYSIPKMAKEMDLSYSQCKTIIKNFKLTEKFIKIQEDARKRNPSLSEQGKALGLSDTRDVRRYLKENNH